MKTDKSREIILTICCGLIIFYFIFRIDALLYILLGFTLIGAFSSWLSSKIAWLWMGLGKILGHISSRILLGVVFFLLLTPLALIRKLSHSRKYEDKKKSNLIVRNHLYSSEDFSRPF